MKFVLSFAAIIVAGLALAQTPPQMPNRIPPEQQKALDDRVKLEQRKPEDIKVCDKIAVDTPIKHPGNVTNERAAAHAKCMTERGHYVP